MATSEPSIRLLGRRTIGENARFSIHFDDIADERGNRVENFLAVLPRVEAAGGVTGIAALPVQGERVGLMRIWRHPYGGAGWEVAMGFMDAGESAEAAALRELQEETGLAAQAGGVVDLGLLSPAPSIIRARIRLYAVHVQGEDSGVPAGEAGHGHFAWFSRADALDLAARGDIVEPCTLVALYRYLLVR